MKKIQLIKGLFFAAFWVVTTLSPMDRPIWARPVVTTSVQSKSKKLPRNPDPEIQELSNNFFTKNKTFDENQLLGSFRSSEVVLPYEVVKKEEDIDFSKIKKALSYMQHAQQDLKTRGDIKKAYTKFQEDSSLLDGYKVMLEKESPDIKITYQDVMCHLENNYRLLHSFFDLRDTEKLLNLIPEKYFSDNKNVSEVKNEDLIDTQVDISSIEKIDNNISRLQIEKLDEDGVDHLLDEILKKFGFSFGAIVKPSEVLKKINSIDDSYKKRERSKSDYEGYLYYIRLFKALEKAGKIPDEILVY